MLASNIFTITELEYLAEHSNSRFGSVHKLASDRLKFGLLFLKTAYSKSLVFAKDDVQFVYTVDNIARIEYPEPSTINFAFFSNYYNFISNTLAYEKPILVDNNNGAIANTFEDFVLYLQLESLCKISPELEFRKYLDLSYIWTEECVSDFWTSMISYDDGVRLNIRRFWAIEHEVCSQILDYMDADVIHIKYNQ